MKGTRGLRLASAAMTWIVILSVDAGVASAQTAAPYFRALPGSGATELQTARYGAVAAALPNGEVLIAGGQSNGDALRSAELFDPADGTFTVLPASGSTELQTSRAAATAAALPDGQVLIAGGYDSNDDTLQSAELFNPDTGAFTALPASGSTELQTARYGASAAALPDGQVLIAGGKDSNDGTLRSAELFNPSTDTFTVLPASGSTELQTPRAGAAAAALPNGQVLIAGGYDSNGGYLQSAELFNPSTDTFTVLPASGSTELQAPRAGAAAAALPDGHVLVAGGYNSDSGYLQSAELFNPATDTFTVLPASGSTELQTPRAAAAVAALPDGQVLIAGGDSLSGILQSAELYNSAPEAAVTGGDFGAETVGQSSALQSLVVTNVGAQALTLSGAALDGVGNPGDFAIISDTCAGRTLTFGQRCTITARFTPSAAGMRSATIDLSDNEPRPSTIALSGTGVAPNTSPAGAAGATGATGGTDAAGVHGSQRSEGKSGRIYLFTCRTVTKRAKLHGKTRAVTKQRCTTRLVPGTARFGTTIAKATLTRNGVIYATGTARLSRLTLHANRPLRAGEYTLTLTRRLGRHRRQSNQQITID